MSEVQQINQDLQYVRNVLSRRQRADFGPPAIMYLWAIYVIVGYTLIDFWRPYSGPFLAIGGMVGGLLSWQIGKYYSRRAGESNRALGIRGLLHMGGGMMLAVAFTVAMSELYEPLRPFSGQLIVAFVGMLYFLWGVHYHRYFLFLGIIVMAGVVVVERVPHFGWTALGVVIALGLILPTLIPWRRREHALQEPAPQSKDA
jgi:hypothetical protein